MDLTWMDKLRDLASGTAASFGVELFDIENRTTGRRWLIRVTLDRLDGPVTIGDCEAVSRQLSAQLDVEDLVPHAFDLEVSSPGAERPLRSEAEYKRFKGREAKVVLAGDCPKAGQAFEGEILGADAGSVSIKVGEEVLALPIGDIKRANLILRFP